MIIIDEMSMVDLPLMKALLDAIMPGTQTDHGRRRKSAAKCRPWKSA